MANYEHLLLLQQGVSQWNEWRRQHLHYPIDLVRADLRGMRLRWIDLRDADLRGADLTQANLQGADLRWANLAQANLTQADLQGATLSFANLQAANLEQTNFRAADLRAAQLQATILETADFSSAILSESDLTSTDFIKLDLPSTNLTESELITTSSFGNELAMSLDQVSFLQNDSLESDAIDKTTESQNDTLKDWQSSAPQVSSNHEVPSLNLGNSGQGSDWSESNTLADWIKSYGNE